MDIVKVAKYFYNISNIPVALYRQEELFTEFCVRSFRPHPAYFFVRPILTGDSGFDMDVTVTDNSLVCGYVQDKASGQMLVLGPVLEFPCMKKNAYRILTQMHEPRNRADELILYFEKIPTMPLTTFTKNIIFLNYILNEEEPGSDFMDRKLEDFLGPEWDISRQDRKIVHNTKTWDRQLEACVEYGRLEELGGLLQRADAEGKMGITANNTLRSIKNVTISSIALVARAAARGGMDYETALTLSDEYIRRIEQQQNYDDVLCLVRKTFYDYTSQVAKIRSLNTDSMLARKVAGYIQEHIYEQIKIDDIAEYVGNNSSYLCRAFKKDTGKTMGEYINEVKIEEAKRLLSSTDKTIVEIAVALGYSSQSYFTTLFGKWAGTTPAEYREGSRSYLEKDGNKET